jgi:hypothetical protein
MHRLARGKTKVGAGPQALPAGGNPSCKIRRPHALHAAAHVQHPLGAGVTVQMLFIVV